MLGWSLWTWKICHSGSSVLCELLGSRLAHCVLTLINRARLSGSARCVATGMSGVSMS